MTVQNRTFQNESEQKGKACLNCGEKVKRIGEKGNTQKKSLNFRGLDRPTSKRKKRNSKGDTKNGRGASLNLEERAYRRKGESENAKKTRYKSS